VTLMNQNFLSQMSLQQLQHSVAGGIVVFVRPCVRPKTLLTHISCRVFDTFSPNLCQRCIMGTDTSEFGVKRSKVKVTVE